MSTYDRIADLCKKKGISVTGLEAELGFGRGSLGKMKKGGSTSVARLQKIADYFGISINELMDEPETVQAIVPQTYYYDVETMKIAEALHKNKELRVLFDAAQDISSDDLYFVYGLIQRMKKNNRDE